VIATIVGVRSMNAWRWQLVGQKRLEIAEAVLVKAEAALDAIREMRNPLQFKGEGESRKAAPDEDQNTKRNKDRYFVAIERYQPHVDVWRDLDALDIKCRVHFNGRTNLPLRAIINAPTKIAIACRELMDIADSGDRRDPETRARMREAQAVVTDHGTREAPDPFMAKLFIARDQLHEILQPYLAGRRGLANDFPQKADAKRT
jgi:hypothetical protein